MMATYYGLRPMVRSRKTENGEEPVIELCDFSRFRDLWFKLRVDVGASSYFSEIAMTQTLDNLRQNGTLDVIQYLERVPDKLIPRKAELIAELKATLQQAASPAAASKQDKALPTVGGQLSADKVLAQQPTSIQAAYENLPAVAQRAIIKKGQQ